MISFSRKRSRRCFLCWIHLTKRRICLLIISFICFSIFIYIHIWISFKNNIQFISSWLISTVYLLIRRILFSCSWEWYCITIIIIPELICILRWISCCWKRNRFRRRRRRRSCRIWNASRTWLCRIIYSIISKLCSITKIKILFNNIIINIINNIIQYNIII